MIQIRNLKKAIITLPIMALLLIDMMGAFGSAATLEDQLKQMDVSNQAPAGVSSEKLYAIQTRYLPLRWKSEVTVGGAMNLTNDSFLSSQQMELGYRLHIDDRWSVGLSQAWVNNKLTSEATTIRTRDGAIPDVPYAVSRTDLMAEYNVFYGKFRWGADSVSYFDVYLAAGPGIVRQNTGTVGAAVGDIGFAFWLGQWGSARLGLKDYYYNESYRSGTSPSHNLHAHLDVGYLF